MSNDPKPVTVHGPFEAADLAKVIDTLKPGEGYLFREIYNRYREVALAEGRRPCAPITLGKQLHLQGHTPGRWGPSGHRVWILKGDNNV